jgi:hypothetical protein
VRAAITAWLQALMPAAVDPSYFEGRRCFAS